jgi:hypothetical protein
VPESVAAAAVLFQCRTLAKWSLSDQDSNIQILSLVCLRNEACIHFLSG